MTSRTHFLSRLIGLYFMIVAIAMATHRQATVDTFTAIVHNPSLMLVLGMIILSAGLAIVLAHNLWSGGVVTVLVTIIGWLTLAKGVFFLVAPTEAEAGFYLNTLHYAQLFYLYVAIDFVLGAFLAYGGFTPAPRSGKVPLATGQQSSAHS
jgi:vacuolar-type H+-ATPase subunit I/STV1